MIARLRPSDFVEQALYLVGLPAVARRAKAGGKSEHQGYRSIKTRIVGNTNRSPRKRRSRTSATERISNRGYY